jgi:hypothetical protein
MQAVSFLPIPGGKKKKKKIAYWVDVSPGIEG